MVIKMIENLPLHVGIIMDGNGRYAENLGKKRSYGHEQGSRNLKKLATHIYKKGIKYLSVYAFSTDNFKRSKKEVDFLMNLFVKMFKNNFDFLMDLDVKVIFSGRRENLPKKVLESMDYIVSKTENNKSGVFNVCLNYGSCEEIVDACKKILAGKVSIDSLTKEDFYHYLYQDLPPLDLVIRTSGEYRLSNFMLYQSSYAEYCFVKKNFPEFSEDDFDLALAEYNGRKRRFGGVINEDKNN